MWGKRVSGRLSAIAILGKLDEAMRVGAAHTAVVLLHLPSYFCWLIH